jgi:3-oxoadipate enol-lactonase
MSELAYDSTGRSEAPVVVLAGSLGTTRAMWQPQLAAFAAHSRVVRFDHLGHGASATPPGPYTIELLGEHLLRLLDELDLPRVSYCGLSLGGMLGMWFAAHHPDRIDRLALLCTSAYLPPAQGWLDRAERVRRAGTADIAAEVVARWFTPGFASRRPDVVESFVAGLVDQPDEGYAACCEAIAAMDLRPVLPRITAATLVVAGTEDLPTPPEHGRVIAATVAGARFVTVPDAAHLASVEQPDAVNKLLLEHFAIGRP